MADTNKIKIDNTIFNNMNSLNPQLGNDFFTNYGNMNTESLELNEIKNVDYYYSNSSNNWMPSEKPSTVYCSNSSSSGAYIYYNSEKIYNAVSNRNYVTNGGSYPYFYMQKNNESSSYYNMRRKDDDNNNEKSKIETVPKKKEKRKTNLINYEDYLKNPSKYDYQMNNNTTMYVNELYNKYKVFNSSKMAQMLGDKYDSQDEFNEQQKYLKNTLSRYYFDFYDEEIAYIDVDNSKVYSKSGLIFTISDNLITSITDVNSDVKYIMEPEKTYFSKYIDQANNVVYKMNDYNLEAISIFDNDNLYSRQYGGDQGDFRDNTYELLQDPLIISRLKEYYPDASMEDYHLYLCKLNTCGCGYTALVNTVFNEYQGREKEFEQKFGYPMYTVNSDGDVDYNYEYMILDYFNYIWGNSKYSIQELYGNVTYDAIDGAISGEFDTGKAGGTGDDIIEKFSSFLKEKYDCNVNIDIGTPDTIYDSYNTINRDNALSIYNSLKKDDNQIYFCGQGYDLYNMDGTLSYSNGGGHAMYITGVTSDNKFIVSSWGEKYILGLDAFEEGYNRDDKYLCFKVVDFNS